MSKGLWKDVWAGVPEDEVPITSITNGIHTKTWAAPEFMDLYTQYLGADWEEHLTDVDYWLRVNRIPDEVLWETHQKLKARLIDFTRNRVRIQRERLGESPAQLRQVNQILNPEILTIGFARRFATYKRGSLLFGQPERLLKLINNAERPVQFVFAGKAHPKDDGGKKVIQEVYKHTRDPQFANRVVFIEDYDAYIGRRLYQGVDLWLNNPLRPLEASGTSGMKLPAQRRAEPERARRLVVRGLQRQERLAHRRGNHRRQRGVPERGGHGKPLPHPRNAGHPALLRQAGRPAAHRVAAVDARVDAQRHARLQHAPHGQGIPGAPLRHGGAGRTTSSTPTRASRPTVLSEWKNKMRRDWAADPHQRRADRARRPHAHPGRRQAGHPRARGPRARSRRAR